MGTVVRVAAAALLLVCSAVSVEAQRVVRSPLREPLPSPEVSAQALRLPSREASPPASALLDSTRKRDKSLPAFLGAVAGAALGLAFYKEEMDDIGDGDFAAPLSIAIYGGAGALAGGLAGWLLASIGEK